MTALTLPLLSFKAAEANGALRQDTLRILYANTLFANVNRNDLMAAMRVWVETVGRNRGFELEVKTDSYGELAELEQSVSGQTADLLILNARDYLRLARVGLVEPVFAAERRPTEVQERYLVLARRDRSVNSLADLAGRRVLLLRSLGANLARLWLETELDAAGLRDGPSRPGEFTEVTRASAAVLPVFFGKADACVVNESGWTTMRELNPQVGAQLAELTASPPFLETVICLHRNHTLLRDELLQGLAELHNEPRGEQLLLVFKTRRLVPFRPEFLDTVQQLMERQSVAAGPPAGPANQPTASPRQEAPGE